MITIDLSTEDLARTRFAFSALWEAVGSFRALRQPECYPLHLPWLREAGEALRGLDLSPLETLVSGTCYPDFLTPPPTTPLPDFAAELAALRATPPEVVRRDIASLLESPWCDEQQASPLYFGAYLQDPAGALQRLADALHLYWERTLAHHWPRIRALLEADILYRAKALALGGPEEVLGDLHPLVSYQNRQVRIRKKSGEVQVHLSGRGLLLVPSVFMEYTLMRDSPWQETMQYGARGTAGLWCAEPPPAGEALEKLLGTHRARLLKHLVTPSTTRDLSSLFRVTPSAVSQHLGWLRETGLVSPQRQGKNVYYSLSVIGEGLLGAYGELEPELVA